MVVAVNVCLKEMSAKINLEWSFFCLREAKETLKEKMAARYLGTRGGRKRPTGFRAAILFPRNIPLRHVRRTKRKRDYS